MQAAETVATGLLIPAGVKWSSLQLVVLLILSCR